MPNIGAVLKSEITRLSRKEAKTESDALKKASAQYRRDIAALKRQVADLEKFVKRLGHTMAKTTSALPADKPDQEGKPMRFVAKGLVSLRKRLGLTQGALADVLGVSSASIFNWESGNTKPRAEQLQKIVALRSMSKAQIEELKT